MVANGLRAMLKLNTYHGLARSSIDAWYCPAHMKISSHDKLPAKGLPSRERASRKGKAHFRDSGRPRGGLFRSEGGVLIGWAANPVRAFDDS